VAVRIVEAELAGLALDDLVSALMDICVMGTTEQGEIVYLGLAAIGPVLDVVTIEIEAMIAAGEAAGGISQQQGALDRGGDGAGPAADGQRLPSGIDGGLDKAAITGEPTRSLGRESTSPVPGAATIATGMAMPRWSGAASASGSVTVSVSVSVSVTESGSGSESVSDERNRLEPARRAQIAKQRV
jgi:hypothetical protein